MGNCQWRKWQLQRHHRLRPREKDDAEKSTLLPERIHLGWLSVTFGDEHWLSEMQGYLSYHDLSTKSSGYVITEAMGYQQGRLRAFASVGYFSTDDFSSHIYRYEHGLLYTFAFPVFSGEDMRYAISVRWDTNSKLMFMTKLGTIHYFDRGKIDNPYQQINQSSQTDLEIQLRRRF